MMSAHDVYGPKNNLKGPIESKDEMRVCTKSLESMVHRQAEKSMKFMVLKPRCSGSIKSSSRVVEGP